LPEITSTPATHTFWRKLDAVFREDLKISLERFLDPFFVTSQNFFLFPLNNYPDISNRSAETAARFSWPKMARGTVEEYRRRLNDLAMASSDADS
jgi:hypothetical protein